MPTATDTEHPVTDDVTDDGAVDTDTEEPTEEPDQEDQQPSAQASWTAVRRALLAGSLVIVALAALLGWLGFRTYQSHQNLAERREFLQTAKQGALNLTTIDWQHADTDVHRILDGATGEFYDDFLKRSQPFIEVVKQAKAKTVGTITEAGLESSNASSAQALVTVSVQTSNAVSDDHMPREWRMRINVDKIGDQVKVSNVGFVP
ncbi:MAG: mammalian cell entry protein [Actinomycetota bacterium]|uniref:Mammalian cell entry protein n=1 Tax=Mycobacterium lentiflavum TaxID=141349 RepID=A0ABY3UL59_MYCLN|nr:mammalian cell entry protein [Mycobacterium lentiflavum]MEE3062431.1 mammalian cell entry protein [Actinomycetota bacterium]ULP40344.1 mammalian cell entry protein [Mycobacterium lentiflavum]